MSGQEQSEQCLLRPVAYIRSPFPAKFGVPRQSGLAPELRARVVFTEDFRDGTALRGLEEFSHLWLIWQFSANLEQGWSPTVRPPRLGGNERRGVFASRSPFRPNPLGLSCVELLEIGRDGDGPYLLVAGADLTDGTPIYDIKPYLPFSDSRPDARAGYAAAALEHKLQVVIPDGLLSQVPPDSRAALAQVLALDPRPGYQQDPQRVYGLDFAGLRIRFRVEGDRLTVCAAEPLTVE